MGFDFLSFSAYFNKWYFTASFIFIWTFWYLALISFFLIIFSSWLSYKPGIVCCKTLIEKLVRLLDQTYQVGNVWIWYFHNTFFLLINGSNCTSWQKIFIDKLRIMIRYFENKADKYKNLRPRQVKKFSLKP